MVPPTSRRVSRVPRYSGSCRSLPGSLTGLSPSPAGFPKTVPLPSRSLLQSITPADDSAGLGSFPFARRYSGNRCFFRERNLFLSFPPGTEMFQFPGFPSAHYGFMYGCQRFALPGFPIQRSADQWIFAPPRSFSQLITSFFGS